MSYIHPAALAARRKYWTRHDAYRFAAPGTPEAERPGWLDPSATRVRLKEAQEEEARRQELVAQEEFEALSLLELRWLREAGQDRTTSSVARSCASTARASRACQRAIPMVGSGRVGLTRWAMPQQRIAPTRY